MSQIVTRKGPVGEDKEKRQTDSPVKDMKKKIAANAEKEKQAAEKPAEKSASDKSPEKSDKSADKKEKDKSVERVDKKENKNAEKADKGDKKEKDKSTEKVDKKDKEKTADKKEKAPEKSPKKDDKVEKKEEKAKEDNKEKNAKIDRKEDEKKPEENSKQNGARALNGDQNGDTVSSEDEDLDTDRDEIFPELAYDDSDVELFERPTPEGLPSRSYTRRSQVKAARTPETPRPASDKRVDAAPAGDESKEKVLKLKEDAVTERKLRSSASPKPEKIDKKTDSPRKGEEKREDRPMEIEIVIELDNEDEARKPDTNYSRSRVKVSPYRRSTRHADVTCSSTAANYTGNNTTMETDITESSFVSEAPDSPYLSGLRAIRGRRSYKPLKEMNLRNIGANRSTRSTASLTVNEPVRPTGTVVGRKRKPDSEGVELAEEALGDDVVGGVVESKRPRLLQRLARPFRTLVTPRHAEIVGINTDLPLSAPVACADAFDPEAIKAEEPAVVAAPVPAPSVPITGRPALTHDRQDPKRCVIV